MPRTLTKRNSLAFHIDADLTHRTHAARDIRAGEELTIAYIDPLAARAARQAQLRGAWGFACGCAQCALPPDAAAASDANLRAIAALEAEMGSGGGGSGSGGSDAARQLLSLYEAERLEAKMGGAYTLAALDRSLAADEAGARAYAARAADAVALEFGPGAADVRAMRELARDPRAHWSWGQAQRRREMRKNV